MKKTFEEYYPSLVINVRSITIDPTKRVEKHTFKSSEN